VVVSPVVRLVFSPTPAVNSADVDDEAMAAIGQRVVAEAPCVALFLNLEILPLKRKHARH
jgi:hypothetical protein